MSWNYRVVEFKSQGDTYREVREVYYDPDGTLRGHASATIYWEVNTDDDPEAILSAIEAALKEPVIKNEEFYKNRE